VPVAATDSWTGTPTEQVFSPGFFDRSADLVAPDLLGVRLVSTVGGKRTVGVIVEVEAYIGAQDPASHAAARIGRTRRNRTMFGRSGMAYVYLSYGVHWCLNIVTGSENDPCAVLVRAADPLEGVDFMVERRHGYRDLASGPGRLGQAFGVTGELDGHDLSIPPLRLLPGWLVTKDEVQVSPRIGISRAVDWPLRFSVRSSNSVSKGRSKFSNANELE